MIRTRPHRQAPVDAELGHIRDLVRLRDLLGRHGATAEELRQYDSVIAQSRTSLARAAKYAAAA
jgi:hypothetical protein